MDKIVCRGGRKLFGSLHITPAKNAILPILAACILTDDEIALQDLPDFVDVINMKKILASLGVSIYKKNKKTYFNSKAAKGYVIEEVLAKELRSSIFLLGSVLSRFKKAEVAYPGGCDIGTRPIDLHIKGLRALGVKITESHGKLICTAKNMKPALIHLDFPSVGATENLILASVFLNGKTTILNAAKEPEIIDLANFVNAMGGKIYGAGTETIIIEGVEKLHGTTYRPMGDRIVAGTFLIATAMCGGSVRLKGINPEYILSLITKLQESGCQIKTIGDTIEIEVNSTPASIKKIETMPYPGFPTDLQAPMLALECVSSGTSMICENLFEARFKHVPELRKMGADITVKGQTAVIKGVKELTSTEVYASDLRGGASLVLAGLKANGETTIYNVFHIDRGYYKIEEDFRKLGADIVRIQI